MVSCVAKALAFLTEETPSKVTVVPWLGVPRTLEMEFAGNELLLETLGGKLGGAESGVTQLASGSVLFSVSFCWVLKT